MSKAVQTGSNPFNAFFECAKSALILPHSNADIERMFSAMNYIKSKLRNKMKLPLLNSVLYILAPPSLSCESGG